MHFEDPEHLVAVRLGIIEGNVPLKYAYTGSGAFAHLELAKTESYHQIMGSIAHEVAVLRKYASAPFAQIADLGAGDGSHTAAFLAALAEAGDRVDRYLSVDMSRTLIEVGTSHIRQFGPYPAMAISQCWWDFEESRTTAIDEWRDSYEAVLVCMLGQTLGNVEDVAATLKHIHSSIRAQDSLLLGLCPVVPGARADFYTAPYRNAVFQRAALAPLETAGIDLADLDFVVTYSNSEVWGSATLTSDIDLGGTPLARGHKIRCFRSRRFEAGHVVNLLEDGGWVVEGVSLDEPGGHLGIVAMRV